MTRDARKEPPRSAALRISHFLGTLMLRSGPVFGTVKFAKTLGKTAFGTVVRSFYPVAIPRLAHLIEHLIDPAGSLSIFLPSTQVRLRSLLENRRSSARALNS